jgi:3'(2'), 5'-bisphosphate nucleotidase
MKVVLDQAVDLAIKAGDAIMEIYDGAKCEVTSKADNSPLTAADIASHNVIVDGLNRIAPQWPVLSEESESTPYEQRREWPVFWLVDPLDGTKEFLKRNGEFTVNIALVEDGRPILGVVYAPAIQRMYFGARGVGAFRQERGETAPIRVQRGSTGVTRIIVSRSHGGDEADVYTEQYGKCEFLTMGSSLKFCLVAEGTADVYPRSGPTMEWDTAAAHCILAEAGGVVTTASGDHLVYNKPSLLNPGFIAQGAAQ